MGAFIMVAGLYSSISSIVDGMSYLLVFKCGRLTARAGYKSGAFATPFTCANQGLS